MKELSIEEKAKLYDEALERAKNEYQTHKAFNGFCEMLAHIFPELKESEDEKIRKWCINLIKATCDYASREEVDDAIAWLEKQSDKDKLIADQDKLIKELGEYKVKYTQEVLEKHINSMSNKENEKLRKTTIAFLKDFAEQGYENAVECIDWLEKQEQKPSNNPEPEFRVGDWVVNGDTIAQILDIQEQYYLGLDINGNASRFSSDDKIRFWTINDAKDGDVLYSTDYIIVVKAKYNTTTNHYFISFCSYSLKSNIFQSWEDCWSAEAFVPATKKERDLIFHKMKKEGYELDNERKVLKKIEQNPAGWSEEDSYMLEQAIKCVNNSGKLDVSTEEIEDWLKSLKPQLKQEWSEEDERIRQCLIRDQEEALDDVRNDKYGHSEIVSDLKEMYRERIDWLKSLRPQNTWKPSKEQMKALAEALSLAKNCGEESAFDLRTLYEQLKECII